MISTFVAPIQLGHRWDVVGATAPSAVASASTAIMEPEAAQRAHAKYPASHKTTKSVSNPQFQNKKHTVPEQRWLSANAYILNVLWRQDASYGQGNKKKEKRKMTMMLPPAWIMVLLHFRAGLSLCVIPKRALQEYEGPWRLPPPFEDEHLEQARTSQATHISPKNKPLGSQMVGWIYPIHPYNSTMNGYTVGDRV